ncbi:single-stranded DNA-binding protein [Snodgrassella sp. B3088]|uniref:single-stranded DNA-binding protein n=1 Tax=Snodgrassella sp. B3088 TaxID=2818038 RepID=UPI002269CFE8|nr:single-stranded DNA-binding protein [Snodgrassella sp. B3088]MCX8748598.1 single-stranded DNA-binding protein [Snodgrassella sp. B3088]
MSTVNKVILIGRLGRKPEIRYSSTNDAMATFTLATEEKWKDRTGNKQSQTEWHNITMFGKLAEIANQYLEKGSLVFIEGRIQSKKYIDTNQIERLAYNIIANEMRMLTYKNNNSTPIQNSAANANNLSRKTELSSNPSPNQNVSQFADDDIPF